MSIHDWYYSVEGQRFGPVSRVQIGEMLAARKLNEASLIWNSSMSDWTPIAGSELASTLYAPSTPPPLTGVAVSNGIVWVLAFAPLIGVFLEGFFSELSGVPRESLWFVTLLLNIVLCAADGNQLKKAGHDTSKMGSVFLVPVYLYKRAQILKQNTAYFWVWCVLFVWLLLA